MPGSTAPIWIWLIVVGIVLSTVVNIFVNHSMRGDIDNPVIGDLLAYQPTPWALAFGRVSYAIMIVGAVLSVTGASGVRLGRHYRVLLCAWIGYSLLLATRNLQLQDFLSSVFFSSLAPGCAIASCLIFASADKETWRALARIVAYGSVVVSFIALYQMAQMRSASRGEAFWRLDTYAKILEITAIVGFGWFARACKTWIGAIPVAVLIAATVAMQTRLMVVELVSLLFFYRLFSQRKLSTSAVVASCLGGLILLWGVYLFWYSPAVFRANLPASASAFLDRSTEDTRSAQFVNFFAKVPAETFILGVGIPRPGEFNGQGSKGIDFGYVNILFIGGIPALVLFFLIHLLPPIRCLGDGFDSVDAACLASVMTYGVRLFSSTVPDLTPGYYILMLLVGRSVMLVQERNLRYRPVYSGPTARRLLGNREPVAIARSGGQSA
jgi:hypothetical protein